MKKIFNFTIFFFTLFLVHADDEIHFIPQPLAEQTATGDSEQSQEQKQEKKEEKPRPLLLSTSYDWIFHSDFKEKKYRCDDLRFGTGQAVLTLIYCYDPFFEEGGSISLGYTQTFLDWDNNPFFGQEHFNDVIFQYSFFTKRFCNWFWIAQATLNLDMDHIELNYSTYDIMLWGRYLYLPEVGIHMGFYAETGLRMDRIYPIIGIDWQASPKWKLNLVYPVDISSVYEFKENWAFVLAVRFFDSRHRAEKHAKIPKAVFRYLNTGYEAGITYKVSDWLYANVHGGYTYGGKLRIANQYNHHSKRFRFDPSGYAGGELDIRF